jgi:hypothetical protein
LNVEKHRYRCAVRELIRLRKQMGLKAFRDYVRKSGFDWQLMRDFEEQWLRGNRADQYGEWK